MDKHTQQNAAMVEEASAAAESMAGQAHAMTSLVRVFKLKGSETSSDRAGQIAKAALRESVPTEAKQRAERPGAGRDRAATPQRREASRNGTPVQDWKEF